MTPKPTDLLTVAEVLAELRIPRRTWQRWRELGTGPQCVRLPNRELRVRRSVLATWLKTLEEAA
ncbi:excisionase [Kineosporia sp. NBRC 101677]|uniref:helix-turn-helix transcriptional regulator n=1 Tax=Kineosporia sp. NBRC 101677 TaxID=3032197 RepID=UPI0024A48299|nr:excisionase [Kineosporia sp. NBRC 101677]